MRGVNAPIIRSLLPACLLHVACADDDGGATNVALQQVSFEAVPTPLFELGALQAALDGATYASWGRSRRRPATKRCRRSSRRSG